MAAGGQKWRAVLSEWCVGRRELFSGHSISRPACQMRCQDFRSWQDSSMDCKVVSLLYVLTTIRST